MNVLVLGGAASGKSAFAEKTACARAKTCGSPLVYLATLNPASGGDTAERIARHRKMRAEKGFATVEWWNCEDVATCGKRKPVVLLEDMGNLVANFLYPLGKPPRQTGAWTGSRDVVDAAVDELIGMMQKIASQCTDFVCVSNEIMLGGELPEGVRLYGEVLAALNARWAAICGEVHAVVAGIPQQIK